MGSRSRLRHSPSGDAEVSSDRRRGLRRGSLLVLSLVPVVVGTSVNGNISVGGNASAETSSVKRTSRRQRAGTTP
jgi:hypothetical protein